MARRVKGAIPVEATWVRWTDHEEELTFNLVGEVEPFVKGRDVGDPDSCYPDSGGEVIDFTISIGGVTIPEAAFSDTEQAEMIDALEQAGRDAEQGARDDAAEDRAERRRESLLDIRD